MDEQLASAAQPRASVDLQRLKQQGAADGNAFLAGSSIHARQRQQQDRGQFLTSHDVHIYPWIANIWSRLCQALHKLCTSFFLLLFLFSFFSCCLPPCFSRFLIFLDSSLPSVCKSPSKGLVDWMAGRLPAAQLVPMLPKLLLQLLGARPTGTAHATLCNKHKPHHNTFNSTSNSSQYLFQHNPCASFS